MITIGSIIKVPKNLIPKSDLDNLRCYNEASRYSQKAPQYIHAYTVSKDFIYLPYGVLSYPYWTNLFKGYDCEFKLNIPQKFNPSFMGTLRDYQVEAVKSVITHTCGILQSPTGSGKTTMGLAIIAKKGLKALWITHTKALLTQALENAKKLIKGATFGVIGAGRVNIQDITFCTVQTLAKMDLTVLSDIGLIMVDECHHACGSFSTATLYFKVLSGIAAKYKYGLSATAFRSDGLDKLMNLLLGDIVYDIPNYEVSEFRKPIKLERLDYDAIYNFEAISSAMIFDHVKYNDLIAQDNNRNEFICSNVPQKTLILTKLVEHAKSIYAILFFKYSLKIALMCGSNIIGNAYNSDIIVATRDMASEGLDLVGFKNVIVTYPMRNKREFIQACGRVARPDGTEYSTIYIVVDTQVSYSIDSYRKCKSYYKEVN